ncbi:hypothetical protein Hanom_Chr09g00772681 [Helianthus anomalus]
MKMGTNDSSGGCSWGLVATVDKSRVHSVRFNHSAGIIQQIQVWFGWRYGSVRLSRLDCSGLFWFGVRSKTVTYGQRQFRFGQRVRLWQSTRLDGSFDSVELSQLGQTLSTESTQRVNSVDPVNSVHGSTQEIW